MRILKYSSPGESVVAGEYDPKNRRATGDPAILAAFSNAKGTVPVRSGYSTEKVMVETASQIVEDEDQLAYIDAVLETITDGLYLREKEPGK